MPRIVWPNAFLLHSCELTEAFNNGQTSKIVKEFLPKLPGKHVQPGSEGPSAALRWFNLPLLGFPRQPFNVFRRPRQHDKIESLVPALTVAGIAFAEWDLREMFEVRFTAVPNAGATLLVEALNRNHEVIPGQRVLFNSGTENGGFRVPGIAALRVRGQGALGSVQGLDQNTLANAADWQRIEVVGFPFKKGEIAPPVYEPRQQGFEAPSLPGFEAALFRLIIAQLLHLPLPNTGVADIPTPDWPAPDPKLYLNLLRDPKPSPMRLVQECLEKSNDSDLTKLQSKFVHTEKLSGIRQLDIAGATPGADATNIEIPVVGTTMLSVCHDSFAATGLGYGTVDFPPKTHLFTETFREPPGTVHTAFDYMVTSEFVLPFFGKIELAALAQPRALPEQASGLTAATLQANRPPARDLAATEAVQLQWNLASQPQSFGIAVSHHSGESQILNEPRGSVGGFHPFVPQFPPGADGAPPPGTQSVFVDPVAPVPASGVLTSRYLVIGLDVFDRWSLWRLAAHSVAAPAVTVPGLHFVTISQNGAPTGRIVPCKIEIEFSWNWSDRSPDRVEFTGTFFAASASLPPASFTAGFALFATGAVSPAVVVHFDAAGNPAIVSGHVGDVLQLAALPGADPDQRKYRLTIEGRPVGSSAENFRCDFTTASQVAYAVFARGAESLRPTQLSALLGPLTTRFHDPIPPTQPTLPIDLRWTALPDAAGRARAVLTWPAAANAAGYIVWEATEAALRHAVDPTLPDPAPSASVQDRATELTALITSLGMPESDARQARSMKAFARLNTELIRTNQIELELPGRADTIFAYRVSSVSASNIESSRSNSVALFAVPRRNQPGQPRLVLRPTRTETTSGIDVIALPGADPAAVGFRVHRVRRTALLNEVGLMGPAKMASDDPGWRDHELPGKNSSVQRGRAVLDPVSESWQPYFYRIVALGFDDPANGQYRGESIASVAQQAFLPPTAPPLLDDFGTSGNATNRVLSSRTDLPIKATSLGDARIEIAQITSSDGRMQRMTILSVSPQKVAVGTPFVVLASPTTAQLAAMPEINRTEPDSAGRVHFSVRVRAEVSQGAITVRDPLGRSTEIQF